MQTEKRQKNRLKQLLYRMISALTHKTLPWGTLTGIRPTKIPMAMLEQGKKNSEIAQYMRETYYTSREKTALSIAIANRERHLLRDVDYQNGYSLYVGIPFCPSICLYCSFSSSPISVWKNQVDRYPRRPDERNGIRRGGVCGPETRHRLHRRRDSDHTRTASARPSPDKAGRML